MGEMLGGEPRFWGSVGLKPSHALTLQQRLGHATIAVTMR